MQPTPAHLVKAGLVLIALAATNMSHAATRWVDATAGIDTGSCSSATAPCRTLQYAVNRSSNGDIVRAKPGTYREVVSMAGRKVTLLADAFAISGDRTATIIDCAGVCDSGSGVFQPPVYVGDGATLTGFTVKNAGGTGVEGAGSVTITQNIITANHALGTSRGGGISVYSTTAYGSTATLRIENNDVFGNSAPELGGGISVRATSRSNRALRPIVIQNNNIHNNATGLAKGKGNGIYVRSEGTNGGSTSVVITQNTITGNTNSAGADPVFYPWGGGMFAATYGYGSHTIQITNNTIDANTSTVGGGVALFTNLEPAASAVLQFSGNTVRNNAAVNPSDFYGFGGGLFAYTFGFGSESITVQDNTVTGNTARVFGGGLDLRTSPADTGGQSLTARDNDVSANRSGEWGGGIFAFLFASNIPANSIGALSVLDNTVTSNTAAGVVEGIPVGRGGGIFAESFAARSSSPGAALVVQGNVVRGNFASLIGAGIDLSSVSTSVADPDDSSSVAAPAQAVVRAGNNLIADNVASSPDTNLYPAVGGGIFTFVAATGQATSSMILDFNTIAGNKADIGAGGIEIESDTEADTLQHTGAASVAVRNSIVSQNVGFGAGGPVPGNHGVITPGGTGALTLTFDSNDFYSNTRNNYEFWIGNRTGTEGNVSVDPRFRNAASSNYRLASSSPVIDAGTTNLQAPLPATDFEGEPRVVDGDLNGTARPDIGCDEFGPTVPVADAGPDAQLGCNVPAGGIVTLNAAGSSDGDSSSGNDDIVSFEWFEHYQQPGERELGTGAELAVFLPLGSHTVTLRVEDSLGLSDTDVLTVVVVNPDADGLCGVADNCPADSNPDQADSDGDGLGNACEEQCDGLDNDHNGTVDDNLGATTCGLGACTRTVANCSAGAPQTCVPGPSVAESCNEIDDDCDGNVDDMGLIACGIGGCRRTVDACTNGQINSCTPGAPTPEACNGIDDDCDGQVDENLTTTVGGLRRTCSPKSIRSLAF